ncbi:Mpo1-like protein [Shewanella benthica]
MRYQSFKEFYPFYLAQHKDPVCRNFGVLFTNILNV